MMWLLQITERQDTDAAHPILCGHRDADSGCSCMNFDPAKRLTMKHDGSGNLRPRSPRGGSEQIRERQVSPVRGRPSNYPCLGPS